MELLGQIHKHIFTKVYIYVMCVYVYTFVIIGDYKRSFWSY